MVLYVHRASRAAGTSSQADRARPARSIATARQTWCQKGRPETSPMAIITNSPRYPVMTWVVNVAPTRTAANAIDRRRAIARQASATASGKSHMAQSWVHTP